MVQQAFGCHISHHDNSYTLSYANIDGNTLDLHENDFKLDAPTIRDLDYFVLGVKSALEHMHFNLKGKRVG